MVDAQAANHFEDLKRRKFAEDFVLQTFTIPELPFVYALTSLLVHMHIPLLRSIIDRKHPRGKEKVHLK